MTWGLFTCTSIILSTREVTAQYPNIMKIHVVKPGQKLFFERDHGNIQLPNILNNHYIKPRNLAQSGKRLEKVNT